MSDRVRVLVADDHRSYRHMLEEKLAPLYEVVPGASTLPELDSAFRRGGFDIALLDLSWKSEGSVSRHLPRWYKLQPTTRVIILTALDEYYLGKGFLEGGAHGFLGKRSDLSEILIAVEAVANGATYFGRDLKPPPKRAPSAEGDELPAMAFAILEYLACGWSRKDIAKAFNLSTKGVDYHIGAIRKFYDVGHLERPKWTDLFAKATAGGLDKLKSY